MLKAFFQTLYVGSPHIRMTIVFTAKSLKETEYFFIDNCNFFHRFSTKYGFNNNILIFEKFCVQDLSVADILKYFLCLRLSVKTSN